MQLVQRHWYCLISQHFHSAQESERVDQILRALPL